MVLWRGGILNSTLVYFVFHSARNAFGHFFFQAEDGIRDAQESRGLGDVYKRQVEFEIPPRYIFVVCAQKSFGYLFFAAVGKRVFRFGHLGFAEVEFWFCGAVEFNLSLIHI